VPVAATLNEAVCPAVTVWLAGCAVMEGFTAGEFTVTVVDALLLESALLLAVTVAATAAAGAVNSPLALMFPAEAVQVTEVLLVVP
jgi:hypothetical protein